MAIFIGLNGLEVAAVADAKSFLGQRKVQEVLNGIWKGDIVFWETLSRNSRKKAQFYNKRLVLTSFSPSSILKAF